ncbi:unnamed protein product [Amoebophrya sp. A25]|nr:unnamed protein product [Amoebophrya sp. A25]|eukprot:GSA25T00022678001.1
MSLEFGDLVLVIGDQHIPQRERDLPECFKELLNTDKIKIVLCTGNCGSQEGLDSLQTLGHEVHVCRGETDIGNYGKDLPESLVLDVGSFKVGVISGYQIVPWQSEASLLQWQRKLGCDILISGHTHEARYFTLNGKLFLNPGSATGAAQHYDAAKQIANDFAEAARVLLASAAPAATSKSPSKAAASKTSAEGEAAAPSEQETGEAAALLAGSPTKSENAGAEKPKAEGTTADTTSASPEKSTEGAAATTKADGDGSKPSSPGDKAKPEGETLSKDSSNVVDLLGGLDTIEGPASGVDAESTGPPPTRANTICVGPAADQTPDLSGLNAKLEEVANPAAPADMPPAVVEAAAPPTTQSPQSGDGAAQGEAAAAPAAEAAAPAAAPAALPVIGRPTPSFMLMAVQGSKVVVYIYKEVDGEITVDQFDHQKM